MNEEKLKEAAIIIFGLGEERAAEVLKHMEQKQVEQLVAMMNKVGQVSEDQASQALEGFFQDAETCSGLSGSQTFIRKALLNAVGPEKAASLIDQSSFGAEKESLDSLNWQPAQVIADMIAGEHPQVIAITLSQVESEKAAQIMECFPKEMHVDLLVRISKIGPISPDALEGLASIFSEQISNANSFRELPIGGVDATANIVNFMGSDEEQDILSGIAEIDEQLCEVIQERMLPFEKLAEVEPRSLQKILGGVNNEVLVNALKGIDVGLREVFFSNMSQRAASILRDDLDAKGPMQISKVQAAQKEIVSQAQKMEKDGEIILRADNDEMVS